MKSAPRAHPPACVGEDCATSIPSQEDFSGGVNSFFCKGSLIPIPTPRTRVGGLNPNVSKGSEYGLTRSQLRGRGPAAERGSKFFLEFNIVVSLSAASARYAVSLLGGRRRAACPKVPSKVHPSDRGAADRSSVELPETMKTTGAPQPSPGVPREESWESKFGRHHFSEPIFVGFARYRMRRTEGKVRHESPGIFP